MLCSTLPHTIQWYCVLATHAVSLEICIHIWCWCSKTIICILLYSYATQSFAVIQNIEYFRCVHLVLRIECLYVMDKMFVSYSKRMPFNRRGFRCFTQFRWFLSWNVICWSSGVDVFWIYRQEGSCFRWFFNVNVHWIGICAIDSNVSHGEDIYRFDVDNSLGKRESYQSGSFERIICCCCARNKLWVEFIYHNFVLKEKSMVVFLWSFDHNIDVEISTVRISSISTVSWRALVNFSMFLHSHSSHLKYMKLTHSFLLTQCSTLVNCLSVYQTVFFELIDNVFTHQF